jgi:AcrR family transcriptional regulator
MVSRTPAVEHAISTKESILDAAAELLAEVGYQRMTIDEVARKANLGKGTIYLYFESKQDLALSIVDRINVRLRQRLRDILEGGGSAEDRLRRMLHERVMFRFDQVKDYKQSVDLILGCLRPYLLDRRNFYIGQEAVIFVEILVEGRTLGVFNSGDPLVTAHALLTATAALLPYSLSPAELGSRKTVEERVLPLIDLLLRAVTAGMPVKKEMVKGNYENAR